MEKFIRNDLSNVDEEKLRKLEIQEKNARIRASQTYLRIAENSDLPKEYRNILLTYATNELSGQEIMSLPQLKEKTYTATEIGAMFDVTANKIGRIAKANNLKTDEYGLWFHEKSKYSSKQVPSFRYYKNAIEQFKKYLNQ